MTACAARHVGGKPPDKAVRLGGNPPIDRAHPWLEACRIKGLRRGGQVALFLRNPAAPTVRVAALGDEPQPDGASQETWPRR